MEKIKAILRNKWFGFIFWSLLYILWFVVWTGNLWLLLGELVIVDLYFTHFLSRLIGRRNREWCRRSPTYKFIYEWVNAIVSQRSSPRSSTSSSSRCTSSRRRRWSRRFLSATTST